MVCESDKTKEIGSELELPKTYSELSNSGVDEVLDDLPPWRSQSYEASSKIQKPLLQRWNKYMIWGFEL